MKAFSIITGIEEYDTFAAFADVHSLGAKDLIFTNEYIFRPVISGLNLPCRTCFQEKYGTGEPTDVMIDAILTDLRKADFDRIIAIGGGTIIDIAKVISVAGPGDKTDDLYDRAAALTVVHPLIIIPTTCGTGSEVTNISVINRVSRGVKMGLASSALYADTAALISELMDSLPYKVFATSSIDAMIHSVESYLSPNSCGISAVFSEAALKMIVSSWIKTVSGSDPDAWKQYKADFLHASNWAGLAFGYAGCAAVHALSYPLGSEYHIPHGQANQLMFADVMRKYKELQPVGRINELEDILSGCLNVKSEKALDELYLLMNRILKKEPLHTFGVKETDLPVFAKNVIATQQRLLRNNYIPLTKDDILSIYEKAY